MPVGSMKVNRCTKKNNKIVLKSLPILSRVHSSALARKIVQTCIRTLYTFINMSIWQM